MSEQKSFYFGGDDFYFRGEHAAVDLPPFQAHSETSRAAAVEIKPDASSLRRKVLAYLEERGKWGATDEEMQRGLDMPPNTQRPRRVELVTAGSVEDSGRQRKTLSGRNAVVWVAS